MPTNFRVPADGVGVQPEAFQLQHKRHTNETTAELHGEVLEGDNMANLTTIELVPPNSGYGWICTFSVFLINAHTWGVNSVSPYRSSEYKEAANLRFRLGP